MKGENKLQSRHVQKAQLLLISKEKHLLHQCRGEAISAGGSQAEKKRRPISKKEWTERYSARDLQTDLVFGDGGLQLAEVQSSHRIFGPSPGKFDVVREK